MQEFVYMSVYVGLRYFILGILGRLKPRTINDNVSRTSVVIMAKTSNADETPMHSIDADRATNPEEFVEMASHHPLAPQAHRAFDHAFEVSTSEKCTDEELLKGSPDRSEASLNKIDKEFAEIRKQLENANKEVDNIKKMNKEAAETIQNNRQRQGFMEEYTIKRFVRMDREIRKVGLEKQ